MTVPLSINGQTYNYPQTGDLSWGPDATEWAQAVTTGMLQKSGGLFQLLAEADFGTSFGLKSLYYKSRTANVASAGQVRLAQADVLSFRNTANSADLNLGVTADALTFNGAAIGNFVSVSDTGRIDLTLSAGVLSADIVTASITNTYINASAAIAYSKLATLTSGNVLIGSAGNVATSVTMSGDATIIASGAITLANSAVTNAKLANMANQTFKGNISGGASAPSDLTIAQTTSSLDVMTGGAGTGLKGLVPAQLVGDIGKFLNGAGAWSVPAGAGDVVGPASSTDSGFARFNGLTGKIIKDSAATISNADVNAAAAIDYSKLAALTSARIIMGNASNIPTVTAITGDVLVDNTGVTSIASGVIINNDINASAAIAYSKLATLTSGNILVGSVGNVPTAVAMSSEATIIASGAVTLTNSAVIGKVLTGYVSGAGTVAAGDTILQGVNKLNGNAALIKSSNQFNNLAISCSVAASALTISALTLAGATCTATDFASLGFRSTTSASGISAIANITAALSIVVSSGSTLGQVSGLDAFIYVYAINNAGTIELAVSRRLYSEGDLVNTTAEGGAGAADSNNPMYSTTARTGVALRLICTLLNNQTTAGTWAAAPSVVSMMPAPMIQLCAKYNTNAGQSISNSAGTASVIDYEDRVYDFFNNVTVGAAWNFKVTQPGVYIITQIAEFASSAAWTAADALRLGISLDGGTNYSATAAIGAALGATYSAGISGVVVARFAADDVITPIIIAARTAGSTTLRNIANRNEITVSRFGDERGL